MLLSRAILALVLLVLGAMIYENHMDVLAMADRLSGKLDGISTKLDTKFQTGRMLISKPRVPPVRHIYKKAPTVIDRICERTS